MLAAISREAVRGWSSRHRVTLQKKVPSKIAGFLNASPVKQILLHEFTFKLIKV